MGLYTSDEVKELQRNCPRALMSLLNAINGSLLIKDAGYNWTLPEVKEIVDAVNKGIKDMLDDGADTTPIHSEISISDALLDKIRTEVLNNPRFNDDAEIAPGEIQWDDDLLAHAAVCNPQPEVNFEPNFDRSNMDESPGAQELKDISPGDEVVEDGYDKGFPPSAEDRILPDPAGD